MVTVESSLANLNRYMRKPISIATLSESLLQMGFELDDPSPDALKMDITADRPDMISTAGIARVLNAYLGYAKGVPLVQVKKSTYSIEVNSSVIPLRPFTAAFVVKNLTITEEVLKEIIYVQEKLHATFARERKKASIGIYPLAPIQWPVRFTGEKPNEISFVPLGETKPFSGSQILSQHPTGKKYAHLLHGFPAYPVFRDAKGSVLSLPPIINSQTTGVVTTKDRELFVEVSGHYWPTVSVVTDILAHLFHDMKGEIYEVHVHFPNEKTPRTTPELKKIEQTLDVELVNATLGSNFSAAQVSDLLSRMMYSALKMNPKQLVVETPQMRADILHPLDVVDDVGRAYGFSNLSPVPVEVYTRGGILPQTQWNDDIRTCVVGMGFQEVMSWVLTSHEHHFSALERKETRHVKLGVAKEQGLTMVRNMLYPETLRALLANRSHTLPFRLFELDQVVEMDPSTDTGTRTRYKLCLVLGHASASFAEIKSCTDALARQLGLSVSYENAAMDGFIEGRVARIKMGKKEGFLGELHPRVLARVGVPFPIAILEMHVD